MLEFMTKKRGFKLIELHRPYSIKLEKLGFNLVQFITWFIFSVYTFKIHIEYISNI